MILLRPILLVALVHTVACGSSSSDAADAGLNDPDAAELRCSERAALTIGHCIDNATNAPCVDFESTQREFIPLVDGDAVRPIIGFQGSPMFVMSVQADGVAPGENQDAAYVEVNVTRGDDDIGGYAARPRFESVSGAEQSTVAMHLFVVAFFANEMAGESVHVTMEIEDRNGEVWCGEGNFLIGELAGGK